MLNFEVIFFVGEGTRGGYTRFALRRYPAVLGGLPRWLVRPPYHRRAPIGPF